MTANDIYINLLALDLILKEKQEISPPDSPFFQVLQETRRGIGIAKMAMGKYLAYPEKSYVNAK